MELLTISLAANETKQFRKAGSYIEIIDSASAISINLWSVSGGQTDGIKGGLSGLYMTADFGAFDVVNGPSAQTVTLMVCDAGESGGSRRQPGNVRVIDQSADQTMALSQFVAMNSVQDAAKGVIVGLWAQTKQMVIRSIQFGSNATTGIALVTGTGRPVNGQGTAPVPANKMIGSPAASSALPVSGTMAGGHPTVSADLPGVSTIGYFSAQANILYRLELKTPLIVPAGRFFGFSTAAANTSVNFIAEIEE